MRYEFGLILETGDIAWVNGPFPAGSCIDLTIFRSSLKGSLDRDERVIADKGYRDSSCYTPPGFDDPNRKLCADLRARHETVNKRFKQFRVLLSRFRHDKALHSYCFHAVANVTQLVMDTEPLFFVPY